MTGPHLQHLGTHATHLAHQTRDGRMQAVLQWVGVGSVILMGLGAAVHMFRDLTRPHHECKPEPFSRDAYRETITDLDRHHARHEGRGHGRHS